MENIQQKIQFLLSECTQIDDNEYLESLETTTELIVSTKEQMCKFFIYFDLKSNLHFKKIFYSVRIYYFLLFKTVGFPLYFMVTSVHDERDVF